MLDINYILENKAKVKKGVEDKGYDPKIVERLLKVDETRRQLITDIEKLRAERNKLTKEDIQKGKKIKETLRRLEPDLKAVEEELKRSYIKFLTYRPKMFMQEKMSLIIKKLKNGVKFLNFLLK